MSELENKTILWVEDDVFLSDIIAKKLSTKESKLLHAKDSIQAFKILETETPDIIMLDILLPGMNGYEILEKIKSDPKTKDIPVIILSNFGQKSEIEKGLNLGAERYLIKATLTLDEIFSEISSILESR
ncbi:MAG: CheY-like chemotaxis protein [Candidatus Paceibacteria bacterium]|jgi:CheY-like chemotaxis protein